MYVGCQFYLCHIKLRLRTPKLGVKVGCGYFVMMMENMDVGFQFYLCKSRMWLFHNDDGKHGCWVSILFM